MLNFVKTTIPKNWKEVKVKDICYLGRGRVISKNEIQENLGNFPVYSSQSFNNGEMGRINSYDFEGEYVTWTTDGAYAGSVFYRNGKFNCTNVCGTLKARDKNVNMRFLSYALQPKTKKHVVYCGNPKLMNNVVAEISFLLPPISEQQKISEILSTVDEDIEKTDEIIEKTEKLKNGLMQKLLTKGRKIKINNVCKINPKQIDPKKTMDKEFNYIDITSVKDYKINNVKKFLGKDAPSRAKREIIENDIIISTVRPNLRGFSFIGNSFNYYLCSTGFCVLRCGKEILPKYLYYIILQDKFVNYLVDKTTGSNYPSVNSNIIGEYDFKLPQIEEQKQTAEILSEVDNKIDINKQIKNKLTQLKKGLMQDLLSGRVRVKL